MNATTRPPWKTSVGAVYRKDGRSRNPERPNSPTQQGPTRSYGQTEGGGGRGRTTVERSGQPERTKTTTTISNARNTNHLHNPKTTPEPGTTEAPKRQSTKSSFHKISDETRENGARLPLGEGGVWGGRTTSVRADTGRPKGGAAGGPEGGSEGQKADRAGEKGYLPRVRG